MAMANSIQGFSGGGGLLGLPVGVGDWVSVEPVACAIPEPVPAPACVTGRWLRLAAVGASGAGVTFTYALLKLAYYWPILQAGFETQFPCAF